MNSELKRYIDERILPLYDRFDKGHNRQHVEAVISQSLALAAHYDVDSAMVYTIAAYHDTGLSRGRELHHLYSGEILASDRELRRWFSPAQIETTREAVEDHRASSKHAPRSLYGRIVAEADRQIDPMTILRRTVQYSLGNCPELDREGHFRRCSEHLHEKYAARRLPETLDSTNRRTRGIWRSCERSLRIRPDCAVSSTRSSIRSAPPRPPLHTPDRVRPSTPPAAQRKEDGPAGDRPLFAYPEVRIISCCCLLLNERHLDNLGLQQLATNHDGDLRTNLRVLLLHVTHTDRLLQAGRHRTRSHLTDDLTLG